MAAAVGGATVQPVAGITPPEVPPALAAPSHAGPVAIAVRGLAAGCMNTHHGGYTAGAAPPAVLAEGAPLMRGQSPQSLRGTLHWALSKGPSPSAPFRGWGAGASRTLDPETAKAETWGLDPQVGVSPGGLSTGNEVQVGQARDPHPSPIWALTSGLTGNWPMCR